MKTTDQTADFGLQQLLSPSAANPEEGRGPFDTKWTANTVPQQLSPSAANPEEGRGPFDTMWTANTLPQQLSPSPANQEEGRGPFDTTWTANTLPQLGINSASSADEFVPQAQGFHFLQIKKEKIILFNLPVPKRFF